MSTLEHQKELLVIARNRGANPPNGERRDFMARQITLPPELLRLIETIATSRRTNGEKNHRVTEIAREALLIYAGDVIENGNQDDRH